MSHNASVVLMGGSRSNIKEVTNEAGAIEAGLVVRWKSDKTISLLKADGVALGVSLGHSQSFANRTAIARRGALVPLQTTNGFTPVVGTQVNISDTTGKAAAAGAGATAVNAIYKEVGLTGIKEDGTTLADPVALIDFVGGL